MLTTNPLLRDRLLARLLDDEDTTTTPREATPPPIEIDETDTGLATLREVMTFMLSMIDLPYDKDSPIPTRGHVARRAYGLFRGPKFMKGTERAVRVEDVAELFDRIVHVLRIFPQRCVTPAMMARLVESKEAVLQRFALRAGN